MCFQIGNNVSVIDDVIKGKVSDIQKDTVFVMAEDGMMYQFHSSELVKIDIEQRELSKFSDINNKMLKEKTRLTTKRKSAFKKTKNEVIMEVDLHVEKLVKSTKGMDNFDILTIQLDTARTKVEYCIRKKIQKIVFIHGIGEGVLRSELEMLLNRYPVKYYDASYQQYGLGATEVYIFQNI